MRFILIRVDDNSIGARQSAEQLQLQQKDDQAHSLAQRIVVLERESVHNMLTWC